MINDITITLPIENMPEAEAVLAFMKMLSEDDKRKLLDFMDGVAFGVRMTEKAS